jgi:outer membrane receptor protein involved in Fe transport
MGPTAAAVCFSLAALQVTAPASAQEGRADGLEEIVVTATKREQRLQDIPIAISAVTGDQLQQMGAQSLSDYITKLPGVHFNDYQPGVSEVIIRGISATTYHEQGQTVVGYYINEIPLSEAGWPVVIPDVDTFDLDRVEVLRGPQGTLFGASALGGLVNYIARDADPSAFDAAVESSVGQTDGASDANYAVKGMVNVPLAQDTFAVRLVGLQRYDAGYLDNVTLGREDSNDLTTTGGRLSAVWTPSDSTKLSWLTLYQEMQLDDQTYVEIGSFVRRTFVPEPHDTELLINSLRLDQDVGFADLTVLGAMADKDGKPVFDNTPSGFMQAGVPTPANSHVKSDAWHVEARLASKGEGRLEWLIGAAYAESDKTTRDVTYQPGSEAYVDANPGLFGGHPGSLLAPDDNISRYFADQTNEDLGIFGEISYKVTDTVTLTAGGRYFDTKSDSTITRPPSALFPNSFDPVGSSFTEPQSETGFTPKATVAFRPSDELMIYGTYSQGFRVGGANPNPPGLTGVPTSYDSDTVDNYEIGLRTSLADRRVLLDVAAFHIEWDDMQVRLFTPAPFFYSYVSNAGGAEVDGVEFSGAWRVTSMFDLQASVTWQDAAVSEFVEDTFAPGGGHEPGTPLPGASEWTTSLTATLRLDSVPLRPRFEVSHRYVSEADVAFNSLNKRGDYSIVDVRATATLGEKTALSLFANNVTNEYGTVNAPFADFYNPPLGSVVRPLNYGLRLNWNF